MSAHVSPQQEQQLFATVQADFAESSQVIFYAMSGIMAVAFVVAVVGLQKGRQEGIVEALPGAGAPAG
jgi:hypothetical protein